MSEAMLDNLSVSLMDYPTGSGHSHGAVSADVLSLDEVSEVADFPVALPGFVPDGFSFADAARLEQPRRVIVITYEGKGGHFVLAKSLAAEVAGSFPVVGDKLTKVQIGDRPAALIEMGARSGPVSAYLTLVWENGPVIEQLVGHGLTIEQLVQIATSIPDTA